MNNKFSKHILLILILVLLMIVLVFLSSNRNLNIQYTFEDEINFTYDSKGSIIGSMNIKNNNILPAKIKLDNYILCNKEDSLDFVQLSYSESFYGEFSFEGYRYNFIEVGANDNKKLDLIMHYYLPLRSNGENNDYINTKVYYLYNAEDLRYVNSCSEFEGKTPIKEITINFENQEKKQIYEPGFEEVKING